MATSCKNCGRSLPEDGHILPELREPCPICGSTTRAFSLGAEPGNYSLTGNDVTFLRDGFIGREKQLDDLRSFVESGLMVAVIGDTGVGKTSLLRRFIEKQELSNAVWIRSGESETFHPLFQQISTTSETKPPIPLVIVDDAQDGEYENYESLHRMLKRFSELKTFNSLILLTTKHLDPFETLNGKRLRYYPLSPWYVELEEDSKPDYLDFGIAENESNIQIVQPQVLVLTERLLAKLRKYPNDIYKLSPRKFEELIADLLVDQGCEIELTPQTRDGGKDIIATMHTPLGKMITLVEAKRHRQDRLIDITLIRQLYGVLHANPASHAMFVTSSGYTRDAVEFQKVRDYELSLKEMSDIKLWLANYRK